LTGAAHVLRRLHTLGIQLSAVGRDLRVSAARGVLTDEVRQTIAAAKQDLVRLLQPGAPGMATAATEEPAGGPLSRFQHRLWLLQQLEPSGTAFNLATLWTFDGVDEARVVGAIRDVLEQYEILRGVFRDAGGEPRFFSQSADMVRLARMDLRGRDAREQAQTLEAERLNAVRVPFDLAAEAPIRWHVYAAARITSPSIGFRSICCTGCSPRPSRAARNRRPNCSSPKWRPSRRRGPKLRWPGV